MDDRYATQFSESPPSTRVELQVEDLQSQYLILLSGGIPGTMIPLLPGTIWMGRAEENGLTLPEPSVSRRHASLRIDESGAAWFTDEGSTNGSFRNGHKLSPRECVRIYDGDRLRLGTRVVLKYSCPDLEEEQFHKAMFERTVRDPLTGLYNRAYFFEQLRPLASRAAARGQGLAVFMLDIDHFKAINDRLGHDGGDRVLRDVAALLRQSTRADDLVSRYGGEEFAISMPSASAELATERAERIRSCLAQTPVKHDEGWIDVTASIGVAFTLTSMNRDYAHLITAADRSLYQAKNGGRNRVVCGLGGVFETPRSWALAEL